jgi:leucine dehydrogenase
MRRPDGSERDGLVKRAGQPKAFTEQIAAWDGLAVLTRFDRPTGSWVLIALHDDALGRPTGGTRMRSYGSPAEALEDAQRLAEGMTHKWAAVGLPFGGGKAVIAPPGPLDAGQRRGLLERYGRLLASLGGIFTTGEDLGTTIDDMTEISRHTRHVMGLRDGASVDPGPYTARGVFRGILAALKHLDGETADDRPTRLTGRTVLVQGLGDVGTPLAGLLAAAGARLLLADLDPARAETLGAELDAGIVAADRVFETPCDVFAPCAVGGVINPRTIPLLNCRAVAGSANNQLSEPADADRLHRRGILYAPDYLINGGGALAFGLMDLRPDLGSDEIFSRVEALGDSLVEVFDEAERRGEPPLATVQRRVEDVLRGRRPLPDYARS